MNVLSVIWNLVKFDELIDSNLKFDETVVPDICSFYLLMIKCYCESFIINFGWCEFKALYILWLYNKGLTEVDVQSV